MQTGRGWPGAYKAGRATAYSAVLLLLGALAGPAIGQQESPKTSASTVSSSGICIPTGRVKQAACEQPKTTTVELKDEHPVSVTLPRLKSAACNATVEIDYTQSNTTAKVDGTIANEDCAACSGDYTIAVRVRNENGEVQTLDFHETWARSDEKPLRFTAQYPIGENVDLLGVRPVRVTCTCADTQPKPATGDSR
ncbi:MAG TPA: hypothetical protein VMV37_07195 [Gammaproteobacteria bacterium]|nr:hypothetical protein [Gammaproteobacteria bacterium]